jgi:hypothetical protein
MVTWMPVLNADVSFATNFPVDVQVLTSFTYLGHKGNGKQNPQMLKSKVQ